MEDPSTLSVLGTSGATLGSLMVGGSMAFRTYKDYKQPETNIGSYIENKRQVFQARMQADSQMFQRERDAANYQHQVEIETTRMEFQEHLEYKRMQFQAQMQNRQEELQRELADKANKNNRLIAEFQALAMRETQVMISRLNAMHLLQSNMILDALRTFPLNISPIVLLQNRPHSLKSLLRFAEKGEGTQLTKYEYEEMYDEVMSYEKNPEPLSVFIAPLQVDSRVQYHRELSTRVWELTYHKLESIITKNYGPSGERPVMFYPTAWNDRTAPGMHASETLHFFLKDMPCVVLEPRFDGKSFCIAFSAWNIGYKSSNHEREEYTLPINLDLIVANTAYLRSKKAMNVMDLLEHSGLNSADMQPFYAKEKQLINNIKIYEALKIDEHIKNNTLDELDAFGVMGMLKVDPTHDLDPIASLLAAHIGVNVSIMADTHHLMCTKAAPIFHKCVQNEELFNPILNNIAACKEIVTGYENLLFGLGETEYNSGLKNLYELRKIQVREISKALNVELSKEETVEDRIRDYARRNMSLTEHELNSSFDDFFFACRNAIKDSDKQWFYKILPELEKIDSKNARKLEKQLER